MIRTRFAPSPTGFLHVGGIRTALFAYLVAKQADGKFVLRLEDTDKAREVEGSAEHLMTSLRTLGIDYDEGPDNGGPYEPYIQSQRLESYKKWAEKLIADGRAYADPYTAEEVQSFREETAKAKKAFLYRDFRPENPPVWDGSQPLRFKSEPKTYNWHDEVMGDMVAHPENIDDFILIKSDGYPTYNFAHIIDDLEMEITHVIRGQEFISSVPNYLNLYEALGIKDREEARSEGVVVSETVNYRPLLAHMPHIMNEQGNKKLGKRDGAKDVLDYIRDGYLPEALVSFIATMGWNDGTEQEIFTKDELIKKFDLARVQRSGARFDEKRLLWMNGQLIRELPLEDLAKRAEAYWPESATDRRESYKKEILQLIQDRLKTLSDIPQLTEYFFIEPNIRPELIVDNKQLSKLSSDERKDLLVAVHHALEKVSSWTADPIQDTLNQLLDKTGSKPGILFGLVRIATTWSPFSPQLNDTLVLIGRDRTLARLEQAIAAHI